jgi:hypothetical protein
VGVVAATAAAVVVTVGVAAAEAEAAVVTGSLLRKDRGQLLGPDLFMLYRSYIDRYSIRCEAPPSPDTPKLLRETDKLP